MMLSVDKIFKQFIEWLIAQALISQEDVDVAFDEFGGIIGVIEDEYYVSAYEELGRILAGKVELSSLVEFMQSHKLYLSKNPDHFYYFVEAIVDEVSAKNSDVKALIDSVPEGYQSFLKKRFN